MYVPQNVSRHLKLAANGAQDKNRIHELRITSGSNAVRFFDRLLSAFG